MKKKVAIPVLLVILALAAAAIYQLPALKPHPSNRDSFVLYGNVDVREVRLAFNGSEHVGAILVEEGDEVTKGQLLAKLHTDRLKAELQRAKAEVTVAEAEARSAQLSYQRIKRLAANKLASRDDADVAEAKHETTAANVIVAKALLAETELSLEDSELYAPVSGVIRERVVEPGDFVTPQSPVLTLALTNPVWVRTYLPETRLGVVKSGTVAEIRTDSYPDKVYEGWVGSISPTAEFTPKSVETPELRSRLVYQVRVYACNPNNELRLGMPATVTLRTGQQDRSTSEELPEQRCGTSEADTHSIPQSSGQP